MGSGFFKYTKETGGAVSGELGLAGYRFQYHVTVLTALELWCGSADYDVESIVVEGAPGDEKVDYELIGRSVTDAAVVQVKSRWGAKAWSAPELFKLLMSLRQDSGEPVRLELVANGRFSSPAQRFIELLSHAPDLDDEELTHSLQQLKIARKPDAATLATLRRSLITVRSGGLSELRDQVRVQLRRLRAAAKQGIGDQAAELLRAYLLGLAMDKAEASDTAGRTLRRDEFLAAVAASRKTMEEALASRWGVPVRLTGREHSVRRDVLLGQMGAFLAAEDGLHTVDGHVRSCVLTGPAGIGKTTLAQQYALANAAEFDWIYQLTACGDDDDPTATADVLSEELEQFAGWLEDRGIDIRRGQHRSLDDAAAAVAEALSRSSQSWLLIVDNATTADALAPLLPSAGYGAVLITTRNSAWHGQQPIVRVGALTVEEGRVLVQRRLADMAINDADADALCDTLDCFPLSLVTATSYMRSTRESVGAFLSILNDEVQRLDALNFPLQRVDDYPRTSVAAVNLSLQRLHARDDALSADAMTVLRRASVVFSDRIPAGLLAIDRRRFNTSVGALSELSLIERRQDRDGRDWIRVHRIIQDVVRTELGTSPEELQTTLLDVELAATDIMDQCVLTMDLVTGGALRLHAITLAEQLKKRSLQSWQTTTALLANAGSIAHLQGDLAEALRLVTEALALIPPGDYDPHVAGRRGKTLAALAQLQLDRNETDAARSTLEQARRTHDLHRMNPAHLEALVECMAAQCRVDAYRATDKAEVHAQFDKAKSLPEPTFRAALVRAACLVKIARDMDWKEGTRADFQECAERLLSLIGQRDSQEPLAAATAHLCLAEAHGSDGGIDAAWRHYQQARGIFSRIPGIDPAVGVDESIELVVGLMAGCIDKVTNLPYRDIDKLIRNLLADIEGWAYEIDWSITQRDWMSIRIHSIMAMHAAHNGAIDRYRLHARKTKSLTRHYRANLPSNVAKLAASTSDIAGLADMQNARRTGLTPGEELADSLAAPVRPRYAPETCHHFDPLPLRQPSPSYDDAGESGHDHAPELVIDRARAITLHASILQSLLGGDGPPDADYINESIYTLRERPQDILDHLIGAWRLIDTMSYKISSITGRSIDDIRDGCDGDLIRSQHDGNVDTVPTRAILKCLNNSWHPELNYALTQLDQDGISQVLTDLIHVEYRITTELADLVGDSGPQVVEDTRRIAVEFDSTIPHRGANTYDPATGNVTVGQTNIGEPGTVRLHDPHDGTIDHVWIFGDGGAGKSNMLRVVLLQASISGVFCIFPSDPRNEHHFDHAWRISVETPSWIATNVRDTLTNLDAANRIIDARKEIKALARPTREQPGVLFGIDDADDVLSLPRGRTLVERLVSDGPSVGVGIVAVIRNLDCIEGSEAIRQAIATSRSTLHAGLSEPDGWSDLRAAYGKKH